MLFFLQVIDPHGRTVRYTLTIKDTDNSQVELSSLRRLGHAKC